MTLVLILFAVGLCLSAFFSGSETGFYRATRARLLIDALEGDWIARVLLWLANHPSLFVATALVGNNLANYLISLSIVMGVQQIYLGTNTLAEILAPILLAPVVFIYGELLPKHLFLEAPNRLLRRCGPPFFVVGVLFAPITLLLWAFDRSLRLIVPRSPQEIRLALAKRELADVLEEGHEVGILYPSQQSLVQACLNSGGTPIRDYVTPLSRTGIATSRMTRDEMLQLAQRQRRSILAVMDADTTQGVPGYVRVTDLALGDRTAPPTIHPCVVLKDSDSFLSALARLGGEGDALGQVGTQSGRVLGFVSAKDLHRALWLA